jgi:hypothetical protein
MACKRSDHIACRMAVPLLLLALVIVVTAPAAAARPAEVIVLPG